MEIECSPPFLHSQSGVIDSPAMDPMPAIFWLLIGLCALLLEIFAIMPGVGLLFVGLGAFGVAIVLSLGGMETLSVLWQVLIFFGVSLAAAALLWRPMRRWQKMGKTYHNIVGQRGVVVGTDLLPGVQGSVQWSGTVMNAELAPAASSIPAGKAVVIVAVHGNILVVEPVTS